MSKLTGLLAISSLAAFAFLAFMAHAFNPWTQNGDAVTHMLFIPVTALASLAGLVTLGLGLFALLLRRMR